MADIGDTKTIREITVFSWVISVYVCPVIGVLGSLEACTVGSTGDSGLPDDAGRAGEFAGRDWVDAVKRRRPQRSQSEIFLLKVGQFVFSD